MIKVLFLIHDLGQGGAEKVLVNLVNNMDRSKFDISVTVLFGGGVNEQFLKPDIHFRAVFPKEIPANSKWMKLLTPKQLHKICVKDHYDIEVSYLEGPSARVISGCCDEQTKLVSWIHGQQHTIDVLSRSFRSKKETFLCYNRFDHTVCVSQNVLDDFCKLLSFAKPCSVLYNAIESEKLKDLATELVNELIDDGKVRIIAVGTLKPVKGYDRLLRIVSRLVKDGYPIHLYILGTGPLHEELEKSIIDFSLKDSVTMLGYHKNPYKYISKCDLFVCSSYSEGFSTATTEALILGIPVCTVEVSGMKEMLGENNEYGVITRNSEDSLFEAIKNMLDSPNMIRQYKRRAIERGEFFNTMNTVKAIEELFNNL